MKTNKELFQEKMEENLINDAKELGVSVEDLIAQREEEDEQEKRQAQLELEAQEIEELEEESQIIENVEEELEMLQNYSIDYKF